MKTINKVEDRTFREKEPKWKIAENGDIYRYNRKLPESYFKKDPKWVIKSLIKAGHDPDDFEPAQ